MRVLSQSRQAKSLEVTEDPTFTGPPQPASLLEVGEQHRLLQVRDVLHARGKPASSRHVLELHCYVVCSIDLLSDLLSSVYVCKI